LSPESHPRSAPGSGLEEIFLALHDLGLVYRRLMSGGRGISACQGRTLSPLGVGLLYHLARHGARSPSELAVEMAMARPNLTALVRELAGLGLVDQRRAESSRRRSLVELSPEGREMLERARAVHLEYFTDMLGRLDARDLRALGAGARSVSAILGKLVPHAEA
jgi:DNA-binding MarR family transcriptional regulator